MRAPFREARIKRKERLAQVMPLSLQAGRKPKGLQVLVGNSGNAGFIVAMDQGKEATALYFERRLNSYRGCRKVLPISFRQRSGTRG